MSIIKPLTSAEYDEYLDLSANLMYFNTNTINPDTGKFYTKGEIQVKTNRFAELDKRLNDKESGGVESGLNEIHGIGLPTFVDKLDNELDYSESHLNPNTTPDININQSSSNLQQQVSSADMVTYIEDYATIVEIVKASTASKKNWIYYVYVGTTAFDSKNIATYNANDWSLLKHETATYQSDTPIEGEVYTTNGTSYICEKNPVTGSLRLRKRLGYATDELGYDPNLQNSVGGTVDIDGTTYSIVAKYGESGYNAAPGKEIIDGQRVDLDPYGWATYTFYVVEIPKNEVYIPPTIEDQPTYTPPVYVPPVPDKIYASSAPTLLISESIESLSKYVYHFGIDSLAIYDISANQNCVFVSEDIELDNIDNNAYIQLIVEDHCPNNTSIEYYIIDNDHTTPILPFSTITVENEKLFADLPTRFDMADNNYVIRKNGVVENISLADISFNKQSDIYTISYSPIINYNYYPQSKTIKIKAILRQYLEDSTTPSINSIKIKKYGGGILWIDSSHL